MKTIKFSHEYKKLMDEDGFVISAAGLLAVIPVSLEELSESFLDYDTDNGLYALPKKGKYLMLLFQKLDENNPGESTNLFTTLRRSTPEKIKYYMGAIGDIFEVKVVK